MVNHSFAIIAYKDSPYLLECIKSLQNQTVKSTIYISTSTPSAYIQSIGESNNIKVCTTEPGQGIAHDWNFALQQAKTKYVTLAHQDDLYLPKYTALCLKAANKYPDNIICFTDYNELANGSIRSNTALLFVKKMIMLFFMPFKKNITRAFWKYKFLSVGCPIAAPTVMYNIDKIRSFRFSSAFNINMDWDAWSRLAKADGRFIYINQTLLTHRIHTESATTIGLQKNQRQAEDLKMLKRFWPDFLAKGISKIYALSYKSNAQT